MNRLPQILFGLSLCLALGAAVLLWRLGGGDGHSMSSWQDGAPIGGPFALTDQNGHQRSDRDFRGHWLLVYFGYTHCPDVCPATLQEIADALHRLGPAAARVVPLFITLDPQRDNPATLKTYLAAFGPEFVGLTGTQAQIDSVARAWRVYFAKHPLGGDYSVDHASALYLMAPDGRFVALVGQQQGASQLAQDLEAHL